MNSSIPTEGGAATDGSEAGKGDAPAATRIDGFYGGRFHLVQPVGAGYRSGLDALLLAACIAPEARGRLADLGAGTGAVGFAAAARAPALSVVCVEKAPELVALLHRSLALDANRDLAGRLSAVEGDLLAPRAALAGAGLGVGGFDHVLTNPPFYGPGHRASPDPLRAAALVAPSADFLADWFRVSLALLKDGGGFAAILPPAALAVVLPVFAGRLGGPALTPIHPRDDRPAIRMLLTGRKGSRAPLCLLPPRILHEADGTPSAFSRAVADGSAVFGWPAEAQRRGVRGRG